MAETQVTRLAPTNGGDEIDAIARLPRDLAIIKMDKGNMMALAAAHPRSQAAILANIKEQLATYPSFAKSAMYAKPVGRMEVCPEPKCQSKTFYKERCPKCGVEVPQKIARGLSVRAAEAIAAAYKYNDVDTCIDDIDEDKVRLTATFFDYQDGRRRSKSQILSKIARKKDGTAYRIADDRFYDLVCEARLSIMLRGCIMFVVPPGLRSELELEADRHLDSLLDADTAKKIVAEFSQKNVSQAMLERFFTRTIDRWTQEDRKVLMGIWTGLKDGETTVAELFGDKGPDVSDVKARVREANKPPDSPATATTYAVPTVAAEPLNMAAPSSDPDPATLKKHLVKRRELWARLTEATEYVKNDFLRIHVLADFDSLDPDIAGGVTNLKTLDEMTLWLVQAVAKEPAAAKRGPGRPPKQATLLPTDDTRPGAFA